MNLVRLERNASRPDGVPFWLFAWTTFDAGGAVVHLARWQPPGLRRRVWHELEHALDRSFTNATHHPSFLGLVGCIRSVAVVRTKVCLGWASLPHYGRVSTLAQADALLDLGALA